jgi:hypothetical protein
LHKLIVTYLLFLYRLNIQHVTDAETRNMSKKATLSLSVPLRSDLDSFGTPPVSNPASGGSQKFQMQGIAKVSQSEAIKVLLLLIFCDLIH